MRAELREGAATRRWSFAATLLAAAIAGSVAVGVGVAEQRATRDEAALVRQTDACATYFAEITRFNEMAWGAEHWLRKPVPAAGTADAAERSARETALFVESAALFAAMDAAYWQSLVVTADEVDVNLIRGLQEDTWTSWQQVECWTAVQVDNCARYGAGDAPGALAELRRLT